MRYMLDTDICIYIIKQRPKEFFEKLKDYQLQDICISSITLAELEYGVAKTVHKDKNKVALAAFLVPISILTFSNNAACLFGEIRAELEKKGQVIGTYDMLIAAHALSEGLTLVTNNTKEFKRIKGLCVENWA